MSDWNTKIVTIIALLLIVGIVATLLFEIRYIPDYNWKETYKYDSKDPYGAWVFRQSLEESYGAKIQDYTELDSLPSDSQTLYINYGPSIIITNKKQKQLDRFLENGNSILFICNNISAADDEFDIAYTYKTFMYDSISSIKLIPDSTVFTFKYYFESLDKSEMTGKYAISDELFEDSLYTNLALTQDSLSVFFRKQSDNGHIYYYTQPYNFSNIASQQDDYLSHLNTVMSRINATNVILDSPKNSDVLQSEYADSSPIQYILSQPSLAWAYYLTLFAFLLYVLFRGKRKQRIIPVARENKNTSLEYVDTISQLFLSQKQNRKLVEHLEDIFYHKVKAKYFIDKSHPDFLQSFILKSKIDKTEVLQIKDAFKNAQDGYEFTDVQLHRLYKKLENIYTIWK